LAKIIAEGTQQETVYLDLERPSDLAKLSEPELYLETHSKELVILDEIQRKPELFPVIRALVDSERRSGRFLILGSASPDLIRKSSESLAGRIIYLEMSPFSLAEIGSNEEGVRKLWRRGGYPDSFLAGSESDSYQWREAFVQTHLERDIPNLGIRIPASTMSRFWTMLAHFHGQLWNASKIAGSLGVSNPSVKNYLEILQSTFMVRQLPPFFPNIKKRLVKSPKIYLRDSGLLHTLLRIEDQEGLLGHPSAGASWEGWVIEQIRSVIPRSWGMYFYRTSAGAEIDLVLQPSAPHPLIAVEIKRTLSPELTSGFRSAFTDLGNAQGFFVYPGSEFYPLGENIHALPVREIGRLAGVGRKQSLR
ncbi:MAG: ATP-binding protein, partial [bacterium]